MKQDKHQLKVTILGVPLTIQSGEDSHYLNKIVNYFICKLKEVERDTTLNDPLKISMMAGLNIADELLKEKRRRFAGQETAGEPEEIEEITERLIEKIDKSLH
ncbi:MAG: cell division protein ZapA [Spirochaetales bacterium]|nr:cell division protein ZapA [Spirochaetales bacterium]